MAFRIAYKKSVGRDLKRLGKSEAVKVIDDIERVLSEKADTFPVLKGRFAGLRKLRLGDYRVIYALLEDEALILRIAHRAHVYRKDI